MGQVDRTRRRALDAAAEILFTRGPAALTHLELARHSGVGRATIYRHWPTQTDLLVDVVNANVPQQIPAPTVGTARERLAVVLSGYAFALAGPAGSVMAFLVSGGSHDPRLRETKLRLASSGAERVAALIEEGIASGEFPADLAVERVSDQLRGALFIRQLLHDEPAAAGDVEILMTQVLGP